MDPDETLRLARQARSEKQYDVEASYYRYLDKWLSDGGFLPKAWDRHRRATL